MSITLLVCLAGMTCAEAVNYTPENVSASIALKKQ